MPAVTEQAIIGPVGSGGAHGHHGDVVHQIHDHGENRQAQPAVGDDPVDLIGGGKLPLIVLLVAALDKLCNVDVPLVGDDALGIIVQLLFGGLDVGVDMGHDIGGDAELFQHLVIPLEDLDGVPALLLLRQVVHRGLLDMGDGVLHRAGEGVHGNGFGALGGLHGGFSGFHNAVPLQSGDLNDPHAQLPGQLRYVDLVAVFADHIHHVDGDDHGDAQLGQLGGEVQVALQVGAVDDVQDGVGPLTDQVVTGYNFFQGVGRQGVDARQVHDDDVVVLLQLAFLFLYGDAGPVAHKLVGTGQGVEQSRFTAVGVARQGNLDLLFHIIAPFGFELSNRTIKNLFDFDHFGISLPQAQLVAADGDLHGIAQGGNLADVDLNALGDAHVHDPPLDGALPMELDDFHGLSDADIAQCFHVCFLPLCEF